jgi:hypothetical protein
VTTTARLRCSIVGLIGFASVEEQILLSLEAKLTSGRAEAWAALPLVAHNTEFKRQQLERLEAVRARRTPPEFGETDHRSPETYRRYRDMPADRVLAESRAVSAQLVDELAGISDSDLLDPERNEWLRGRPLWLQVIVRGFWHPTGHLGEYYLEHGRPERARGLHLQAVAATRYLEAPKAAQGMAHYSLACTAARLGRLAEAASNLRDAVELNTDLRSKAVDDPDLADLLASTLGGALLD